MSGSLSAACSHPTPHCVCLWVIAQCSSSSSAGARQRQAAGRPAPLDYLPYLAHGEVHRLMQDWTSIHHIIFVRQPKERELSAARVHVPTTSDSFFDSFPRVRAPGT